MIDVRYERGRLFARTRICGSTRGTQSASPSFRTRTAITLRRMTRSLSPSAPRGSMQARLPGTRIEHVLPFGEKRMVHDLNVMLLPAGHIFGSAQFFLFAEKETLLYTGDFKLRPGKSAEPAQWRQADTLIMETTFGLPRYQFPPTEQVIDQIVAFCRETQSTTARCRSCSVIR